jgi:predicted phage-related endonuclease
MSPDTTETEQRPIGAASVAGILGISPYQSPWSVWARLVGLPVPDPSNQDRLDAGTDAEAFLAAQFNRHMERGGLACEQKQVDLEHADYPWLRGRGDGLVTGIEGPDIVGYCGGWEAKTSTDLRPWDEIPPHYAAQCQTYMLLSGYDNWWVTVGFGNWKVRHYAVLADPEDQATIVGETERFWREHVLTGVAPDVDGSDATSDAIGAAFGHLGDAGDILFADGSLEAAVHSLRFARSDLKAAESDVALWENMIKDAMRDCAVLMGPSGQPLVTWKPSTSHRTDINALKADHPDLCEKYVTATTSRRFLLKPTKGD